MGGQVDTNFAALTGLKLRIDRLEESLDKKDKERGKTINKLWGKNKEMKKEIVSLNALVITFEKYKKERDKAINGLWEERKELVKEIAELKEIYGKLTYDFSKLYLENRIMISSAARIIGCENKQFLVKDIVRQLINESGYDLEFKVLQKKDSLTMTGKEIKK